MTEIKIDGTGNGNWWLYGKSNAWKDYVVEDFDEKVVLFGNRYYSEICEAEWYETANRILTNIDCYDEYPDDVSDDVNAKLKDLYEKCRCTEDIIFDAIKLLYPEDNFDMGTINGYVQGDWQNYIIKGDVDVNILEQFFFGKVADITVTTDDEEFGDVITDDELWEAERDDLRDFMRKRYELDENEEIRILKADGMIQVPNWKEIN